MSDDPTAPAAEPPAAPAASDSDLPPFFRYRVDMECFESFEEAEILRGMELAGWEMLNMDTLAIAEAQPGVVKVSCTASGSRNAAYAVSIHIVRADDGPALYTAERCRCSCPHGVQSKGRCKHVAAFLLVLTSDWSSQSPVPRWHPPRRAPAPAAVPAAAAVAPAANEVPHMSVSLSLSLTLESEDDLIAPRKRRAPDDDEPTAAVADLFFRRAPKVREDARQVEAAADDVAADDGAAGAGATAQQQRRSPSPNSSPWRRRSDSASPTRAQVPNQAAAVAAAAKKATRAAAAAAAAVPAPAPAAVTPKRQIVRTAASAIRSAAVRSSDFTWGSDDTTPSPPQAQPPSTLRRRAAGPLVDAADDTDLWGERAAGDAEPVPAPDLNRRTMLAAPARAATAPAPARMSSAARVLEQLAPIPLAPHLRMQKDVVSFAEFLGDA